MCTLGPVPRVTQFGTRRRDETSGAGQLYNSVRQWSFSLGIGVRPHPRPGRASKVPSRAWRCTRSFNQISGSEWSSSSTNVGMRRPIRPPSSLSVNVSRRCAGHHRNDERVRTSSRAPWTRTCPSSTMWVKSAGAMSAREPPVLTRSSNWRFLRCRLIAGFGVHQGSTDDVG
jgi:hypothetical protein